MAQRIWVRDCYLTDGEVIVGWALVETTKRRDDDVEFLALMLAEVAAIRDVIRKLDQCGVCHANGTVTSLRAWGDNTCAQCSGTGFGATGMEVWEMLK